jgi:dihydrofolate reductase
MKISMIAAIGENRELGKNNDLPWGNLLPQDQKRFRNKTRGHAVIVGKRTFESMGGKAWPNRVNIVVSRDANFKPEQVLVAPSIERAIEEAKKHTPPDGEIFVIGGGKIFELAMPYADKFYLTLIHAKFPDADTFFPPYEKVFTKEVYREKVSENGYDYEFIDLEK